MGDPYGQRNVRLSDEYDFTCDCVRCRLEAADEEEQPSPSGTGEVDLTYVSLFVLKHTCAECMGTLAPITPIASAAGLVAQSTLVCNRCSVTRTEEEFLERCAAHFADDDDDQEEGHEHAHEHSN